MTIAVYPWPDQIVHADLYSRQVTFWEKWAKKHSVVFFNFFPSFISPETDPKEVIRKNFIEGDVHWNETGHEVVARELYVKMREAFPMLLYDKQVEKIKKGPRTKVLNLIEEYQTNTEKLDALFEEAEGEMKTHAVRKDLDEFSSEVKQDILEESKKILLGYLVGEDE